MDDDLHDLFGDAPAARAGDKEAAARLAIARVLATLQDPGARVRVLRWAVEQFGTDAGVAPRDEAAPGTAPPARSVTPDPALSLDEDVFDSEGHKGHKGHKG